MPEVRIEGAGDQASSPDAAQPSAPATPPVSPSAELVRQAVQETVLEDAKGRKIRVRKPSVLAQFRIVEAAGPQLASNSTYMQMVNPLIYLAEIDGDPVSIPATSREIDALILRLDDEGMDALLGWYMEKIVGPAAEAMEAAEARARLKNS